MRRRTLLTLGAILVADTNALAQADFSEAVGILARERSLAEDGASFLKRYANDDFDGRSLYAQAKASYDELIEQLLADLAQGHDPEISDDLRAKAKQAVGRRLLFSQHVNEVMRRIVQHGAKPGLADALAAGAGELVKQVIDGGVAIWHEWRGASRERRSEMATRLEAQRWAAFEDIKAAS